MATAAVPQMQPMYYATSAYQPHPQAPPPQQHFIMGPPPAYSNTAANPYPTGYCPPPAYQPPIFHHNIAAPSSYTVPMTAAPQVSTVNLSKISLFFQKTKQNKLSLVEIIYSVD